MKLDINKELFGFQPYEFSSFLRGYSLARGYKYRDKLICDILIYEEEGHYYNYEDENVNFYSPTEINENGTFFFEIKNKFLLTENESFWFYTNFQVDREELEIIMIEAISKNSKNSYFWTYCTLDYLVQTTNKRSEDIYVQYYPTEVAFVLNRFLLLKEITKSDVIDKIQSLKTEEDIISGFYK
ncbi:hypothetical protein J3D55_002342 [Chryseobacterium ginsenosidimutans]|uniref:hypothetical protein n=1 Tax=Chryseobacterium ginsenosidimutans TaxID=687846 RepID=UPI0021684F22|nr:hypothetical protein [Chryseobacterium ginsenosidimutans]MCS3869426.1 hypothetical protein [Chryseobacterium ginsenosidimutans]